MDNAPRFGVLLHLCLYLLKVLTQNLAWKGNQFSMSFRLWLWILRSYDKVQSSILWNMWTWFLLSPKAVAQLSRQCHPNVFLSNVLSPNCLSPNCPYTLETLTLTPKPYNNIDYIFSPQGRIVRSVLRYFPSAGSRATVVVRISVFRVRAGWQTEITPDMHIYPSRGLRITLSLNQWNA